MTKFNEEIIRKVEEREKESNYLKRCIGACICPDCGEALERHITDDENLPDEVFNCSSCKFGYSQPWA